MSNSRYYFPHDYHARHDPKLSELLLDMGCEGVGIYWCLIEMMYEEGGYLQLSKLGIYAKMLNTTVERLEKVINAYNLFLKQRGVFSSQSLLGRLKHINGKRWKAKVSANKRWNANAMPTQCEGNASRVDKRRVDKRRVEIDKTSPTTILLNHFCKTHQATLNQPYVVDWGKDGAIFKGLLSTLSSEEIIRRIDLFFGEDDEFVRRAGYTVGVFKTQVNRMSAAGKKVREIDKYIKKE